MAKTVGTKPKGAGTVDGLVETLETRFRAHKERHPTISWETVEARLDRKTLTILRAMEESFGEPDVVLLAGHDELVFVDCAAESPRGRRSLCYDKEAWAARKQARPKSSALEVAAAMGVSVLTEQDYRALQELGAFDTKTSSWLTTPKEIRALGGALFGDRRYDHVFTYHNGAESYYAARGFRAKLEV